MTTSSRKKLALERPEDRKWRTKVVPVVFPENTNLAALAADRVAVEEEDELDDYRKDRDEYVSQ
jgi:hypothetical protein